MSKKAMIHARTEKGRPFLLELPNDETLATFRDSDAGKGLTKCKNADDMFRKLGV